MELNSNLTHQAIKGMVRAGRCQTCEDSATLIFAKPSCGNSSSTERLLGHPTYCGLMISISSVALTSWPLSREHHDVYHFQPFGVEEPLYSPGHYD